MRLAILGATGLVGEALIDQLSKSEIIWQSLRLLATDACMGKSVRVKGKTHTVEDAATCDFSDIDLLICAAGANASQQFAPLAADEGALVIDLSPAYRYDDDVPLIVAGVNNEVLSAARERNIVACADAGTVQLARSLHPLVQQGVLDEVAVTQLQPVSSRGRGGVEELAQQSVKLLNGLDAVEGQARQMAFNVLPRQGQIQENGYTAEELKVMLELQRVFAGNAFPVSVTCIGVPVFYGISQSVSVQSSQPVSAASAEQWWQSISGLDYVDGDDDGRLSPVNLAEREPSIYVLRVREHLGSNGLSFMTMADNIRTAAAAHAIEVVCLILKDDLF